MARDEEEEDDLEAGEIPDGAAVFAEIPAELGVDPLLLAVIHSTVFLAASTAEVVHPEAAAEAMEYMGTYLQRLDGERLRRVQEDMAALVGFAKQEKWPRPQVQALKSFLSDYGIGSEED
jgi:hypothetical protein